jgi:hypothetical protein
VYAFEKINIKPPTTSRVYIRDKRPKESHYEKHTPTKTNDHIFIPAACAADSS